MSLEDFFDQKLGTKKKESKVIERIPNRIPKIVKLNAPNHIKTLFDNLDKSITSMWGLQKDGKIKWDSKYNQWVSFKEWFKEMMEK